MMRIVIPTIGSRGDVQPFIALAQGLGRAGHAVTLASHPVMKTLVESHAVEFAPIGPKIDLAERVASIRRSARNSAIGLVHAMRFGFEMLERSHEEILTLCQAVDLVIVPTAVAAGKNEADLLNLPYLSVTLMPWAIPWRDPERPLARRIMYGAVDRLVRLITTRPLNRLRKRQGLPPVGQEGLASARLNLVPVSPAVFAPNPLWEAHHRVVGYWFAQAPDTWKPPASLLSFLEDGDRPVLVSLGAMSQGDGDAMESVRLFVDAIQQTSVRAILQGWEAATKHLDLPPNIYATGPLPHRWLLPRCAGVVHHGGFGTTSAGLRAGVPTLVIPHIADQFYWGQRVHELGVGPKPLRRAKLETEGLASCLDELVRDENLQVTALTLGEQIRSEHGVENAVQLIEEEFA